MTRFVFTCLIGLLIFTPATSFGEEFEFIRCYSGTVTFMNKNKELPMMFSWKENGIIMSKSENKFLDNATTHLEGVQMGLGKRREGYVVGHFVDPDGDMIAVYGAYKGTVHDGEFNAGSGKYKGIKGRWTSSRVAFGKKPPWPGTYQRCRLLKGTYELPPK